MSPCSILTRAIVDFELRIHAQRATEIALVLRDPEPMIFGELLQSAVAQPIDSRIADVKDMRGGGLDHHRAQACTRSRDPDRIDTGSAASARRARSSSPSARVAPMPHRPGGRRAVVILQEAFDGRFAGDLADVAAAHAVGQRDGDAFGGQLRLVGNAGAVKVLVDLLAAAVGMLPRERFSSRAGSIDAVTPPRTQRASSAPSSSAWSTASGR